MASVWRTDYRTFLVQPWRCLYFSSASYEQPLSNLCMGDRCAVYWPQWRLSAEHGVQGDACASRVPPVNNSCATQVTIIRPLSVPQRPKHFLGCTKEAQRTPSCVKGIGWGISEASCSKGSLSSSGCSKVAEWKHKGGRMEAEATDYTTLAMNNVQSSQMVAVRRHNRPRRKAQWWLWECAGRIQIVIKI